MKDAARQHFGAGMVPLTGHEPRKALPAAARATYMPEPSWGLGRVRLPGLPVLRTNPAHWRRAGIVGQPTVGRAGLRRRVQRGGAGLEWARKGMLEGVLKAPVPAPAVRRPSGGGG